MGLVKVKLTCAECGETFVREKDCDENHEASWRAWTEENVTLCPSCYRKKMHPDEEQGVTADVLLEEDAESSPSYAPVFIVFEGRTFDIKDDLKKIGARFSGSESRFDTVPNKRWYIRTEPKALDDLVSEISALGVDIRTYPDDITLSVVEALVEDVPKPLRIGKNDLEIDDDIKDLWPEGGKWNGRFYGKEGNYSIYIGGEKIELSDSQHEDLFYALENRPFE